jgi:hypothetical protein
MKILKYILFVFTLGIIGSCTDLEEETYTFLNPNGFYRNAEDLNMSVVAVYDRYQQMIAQNSRGWFLKVESLTEFGSPCRTKNNSHLYNAWVDVNNPSMTIDIWKKSYELINLVNVILTRGESIEMEAAEKNRLYAEARFLRAITYYNLVRIYGGVPISEKMTINLEGLEISRKTVNETYNYLIADLEYGIQNLPVKSAYSDEEKWRASKGSAQGILGEVYLTRGSMTNINDHFTKCKELCNTLMQSGEYDLEADYKNLWYWWNTENENGIESVFEIQIGRYGKEGSTLHRDCGINLTDPSLGQYQWHRFGPSISAYQSYNNADARKEASFLTVVYKASGDTITFVPEDKGVYPGSKGWTTATPGNIKYMDRTEESYTLKKAGANVYVMRYSDVLLNYAEAENELNGPTSEAYSAINAVRNRVNLPDLPTGLTKEQLADSIYRERGWEFIGEAQLYFDGLRTDRIGNNVKTHVEAGVAQGIFLYQPLEFVPTKNFIWKIPQYDLDSNPALIQNPDNTGK